MKLLTRYITKAKGFDYKGPWRHPLSPYYESKPEEWLPMHPQPGGLGYRHWLGWVLGALGEKKKIQPASQISFVLDSRRPKGQFRLWVFGYDMDNMKARCWYESTFPLYGLTTKNKEGLRVVQGEVARWLKAAEITNFYLRRAIFSAWFSKGSDSFYEKDDELSEGKESQKKLKEIDSAFWSQTEGDFYHQLHILIEQARDEGSDPKISAIHNQWLAILIKTAIRLFDADLIGATPVERQNPRRVADAYNRLRASLHGDKLKEILKLCIEKPVKSAKKSAKALA